MIPRGLVGHTTGFFDDYGNPSATKAKSILTEAGITETVPLQLWYTTDRYGSQTKPAFEELKRQLEASGLFEVTLKSRPWKTYSEGYQKGEYPVFGRGWNPDFNDADNFIAPFVGKQNALGTPYDAPEITDKLIPESRAESDRGAVGEEFRGSPADPRGRRPADPAVAGQGVHGRQRGDRRPRERHRPRDDDDHVAAVVEDQLVIPGARSRCQWAPVGSVL